MCERERERERERGGGGGGGRHCLELLDACHLCSAFVPRTTEPYNAFVIYKYLQVSSAPFVHCSVCILYFHYHFLKLFHSVCLCLCLSLSLSAFLSPNISHLSCGRTVNAQMVTKQTACPMICTSVHADRQTSERPTQAPIHHPSTGSTWARNYAFSWPPSCAASV